jgi:ParB-like chromosome segregation protein Spo0J
MAFPIDLLVHLDNNPRKGNVNAIASSYEKFGQVNPIVAKKNDDGTATIVAGNHQVMAAKQLGWDKIAVVFIEGDDKHAIAYALADNRTMELGYTDDDILQKLLTEVSEEYSELLTGLGWDEFEIAAMDERATIKANEELTNSTYIAPVMINPISSQSVETEKQITSLVTQDEDGENKLIAPKNVDHSEVAVSGSAVAIPGSAPRAIVSVQVVFDSVEQQRRWYDFVRWLRSDSEVDGETTAERLINFINTHTNA